MKKINLFLFFLVGLSAHVFAQDYFQDLKSNGLPVLFGNADEKILFSSLLNAGDNSLKINLYKQYKLSKIKPDNPHNQTFRKSETQCGWGVSLKAKTENGLGSIFGSGSINPGFTSGGYLSLVKRNWHQSDTANGIVYDSWILLLSGSYTSAKFQLFDSTHSFSKQLSDTVFKSGSIGLSFVYKLHPGKDNLYIGASGTIGRQNNYNQLDKVDIKNDTVIINPTGRTRTATTVNDDGNTYAAGNYIEYTNVNFRLNASYIPNYFDHSYAFIVYPSLDISKQYMPKYNIGLSVAVLEDGSPSTVKGAVFFECNDLLNAADSKKTFLKRSFKIGVTVNLNVFLGSKS